MHLHNPARRFVNGCHVVSMSNSRQLMASVKKAYERMAEHRFAILHCTNRKIGFRHPH